MNIEILARGLAVGFTVAAAVGPISLLTIRRTLAHGRTYGLASGMGVALADASYGGVAAFGLTAVAAVLVGIRPALALVGGAFLIWLGVRTILSRPPAHEAAVHERPGLLGAFLSIYGLTMTNPRFNELFDCPPRAPDQMLTQRHMDLAASIQAVTEEVVLRLARAIARETSAQYLCLAGGEIGRASCRERV